MHKCKIHGTKTGIRFFRSNGVRVRLDYSSFVTPVVWEWSGLASAKGSRANKSNWYQFDDQNNFQTSIVWRYLDTETVEALKVEG